jgi:UDPglucose 6-dehydrogenase
LQREKFFNKIKSNIDLKGKKIALWGLSFKPNTDDIREAPALYIIEKLIESGAIVSAYDPEGMPNVKKQLGDAIHYCQNMYDALDGADALVIVTEWTVFRTPDFPKTTSLMTGNVIFDGRNLFDLEEMKEQGYKYFSIGRQTIN